MTLKQSTVTSSTGRVILLERSDDGRTDLREAATIRRAKDLCAVEGYFRENGCSEVEYDEELDVFRFAEDGRFAFCREFADWTLLWERGYLGF
jgi:hypothetical protein